MLKKPFLIVCMVLTLGLLTACGQQIQQIQTIGSSKYYVEIQNEGEEYSEQGYTRYKYELKGYNEDGEDKKLTFTSNHPLRKDAYLEVYYKKGDVITYKEIERDDIPQKPQQLLENDNDA